MGSLVVTVVVITPRLVDLGTFPVSVHFGHPEVHRKTKSQDGIDIFMPEVLEEPRPRVPYKCCTSDFHWAPPAEIY
jgi:hypothetical protein